MSFGKFAAFTAGKSLELQAQSGSIKGDDKPDSGAGFCGGVGSRKIIVVTFELQPTIFKDFWMPTIFKNKWHQIQSLIQLQSESAC